MYKVISRTQMLLEIIGPWETYMLLAGWKVSVVKNCDQMRPRDNTALINCLWKCKMGTGLQLAVVHS